MMKCKRVFQALINIAIEELCETADALIAPVRLGVSRPTAPFALVTSHNEAFQVKSLARSLLDFVLNLLILCGFFLNG